MTSGPPSETGWPRAGRKRPEGGFTLLEVLASLAVLAVSFLVLLQTDGLNASRTLHARRLLGAVQLAQGRMEEVFSSGSGELVSEEGEQEDAIYSWQRVVSDTEFEGLKEVRLIVRWKEGAREEEYVVLAYLPR
ncbi:MAG: prepilin-type N-terminal cleavage/methylation domain-containing protein [bacterium]|nr:MAG: prepilin-type N-terminal cleavage/methylation domain-containing protein [bacterium]